MVIIVRTDEGQPIPKYIFNKCGTNIYFFLLYRDLDQLIFSEKT